MPSARDLHAWTFVWCVGVLAGVLVAPQLAGAAPPAPLDNITSVPPPTAGDPNPAQPPLISDPNVALPPPSNIADFVEDEAALLKLGKALFWDMQLGSDGIQACASCHFKAGADNRSKNQVSPGLLRQPDKDTFFGNCLEPSIFPGLTTICSTNPRRRPRHVAPANAYRTPNHQLELSDFPFFKLTDPNRRAAANNRVLQDLNDVVSSQGVFSATLNRTVPGQAEDDVTYTPDEDGFSINGINVRRVEPRNAPTVINAALNKLQFWDGRAKEIFNGVDTTGSQTVQVVKANRPNNPALVSIAIDNSSLASLVSGPPVSIFEMSAEGRNSHHIGGKFLTRRSKKVHPLRPLAKQLVHRRDSVLGKDSRWPRRGLSIPSYTVLIQQAFKQEWWRSRKVVQLHDDGTFERFVTKRGALADNQYTLAQYNFALFAGLSIQKYLSTLVSDQTPFDRFQAGDTRALNRQERRGLRLFVTSAANGGADCNVCHTLPEGTQASVRRTRGISSTDVRPPPADPLINRFGLGFINNYGIRPAVDDPGAEAVTTLAPPNCTTPPRPPLPACPDTLANSKFKIPNLRNVGLTAPYFHNGGYATLEQVVDFYGRGRGDAGQPPAAPLRALLNRTPEPGVNGQPSTVGRNNKAALVAFLRNAMTDPRVRYERAPFDHPQLFVPNGHPTARNGRTPIWSRNTNGTPIAEDQYLEIRAVGANGVRRPQQNFLGLP